MAKKKTKTKGLKKGRNKYAKKRNKKIKSQKEKT
jgi:hypothetical protein